MSLKSVSSIYNDKKFQSFHIGVEQRKNQKGINFT